jgi:hypothetical protein
MIECIASPNNRHERNDVGFAPCPGWKRHMIIMLEDDNDRIRRFERAVRSIDLSLKLITWRNAHRMIKELEDHLADARLITLDHDLECEAGETGDPGDGMDVVRNLNRFRQTCPVIIHSSNVTRSDWMAGDFELAGWNYHRVAPIGEYWIEESWRVTASELLGYPVTFSPAVKNSVRVASHRTRTV